MIHDFAITRRYVVVVVAPLTFATPSFGHGPLAWRPDLGTMIAFVPRDGTAVRWVHTDTFWAWHYANAFDDGDDVTVDFPSSDAPALIATPTTTRGGRTGYTRATINPVTGNVGLQRLDERPCEFPRIDDRRIGHPHRYATVVTRSPRGGLAPAEHDTIVRYDTTTGDTTTQRLDAVVGEVVFAPRHGGTDELDGYYLAYATDTATNLTSLRIWDAAHFPSPPQASINIPQRVPNGLHGSWIPAQEALADSPKQH